MSRHLMIIVDGPEACTHCLGWGHIANSDDGESWKYWAELTPPENLAVQLGVVFPILCPHCQGSGKAPSAADQAARLQAAARTVVAAWLALGRCEDEFLPEQPEACGEYRDHVDTAIDALRQCLGMGKPHD